MKGIEYTKIFWRTSMQTYDIYSDIATRTNGDIYVGVVGPVRTGKSTFIKRFMEELIMEKIEEEHTRNRVRDELPQSADGKTIMTTEPKFVPAEAVELTVGENRARVRMIDCVGYLVSGAIGAEEEGRARMVKTPWSNEPLTFEKSAELGTEKVIKDHSTVGLVITTDGSVGDIPRQNYIQAEERVVAELKSIGKPFVLILNSSHPEDQDTISLAQSLSEKYGVTVKAVSVLTAGKKELEGILESVLLEFPLKRIDVRVPKWIRALPIDNPTTKWLLNSICEIRSGLKLKDYYNVVSNCEENEYFENDVDVEIDSSQGILKLMFNPQEGLFYKTLSSECGEQIEDDYSLMRYLIKSSEAYTKYEKIKVAMNEVQEKGYGVVLPNMDEMQLEEPELLKKGSQFGVKLKAKAPSIHMMRVDVETEVKPIIGSEQQSEDLVNYLLSEFTDNKQGIWDTNMFGKPLSSLVKEDLDAKIGNVPDDCKRKIRKTLNRIVNEGKGGVICILL